MSRTSPRTAVAVAAVALLAGAVLGAACTNALGSGPLDGGNVGDDDDLDAGPSFDAPPVIDPDDPGAADVLFSIDSSQDAHPISRFIYGHNGADWDGRGRYLTMGRSGGNRLTAYNWENNASNAGSDYVHQNDAFLGGGDTPGEVPRLSIAAAHARGAAQIVTVPIVDHVAADKNGGGDVNQTPDYLATRFRRNHARKGAAFTTTPDTGDGDVYQDELVAYLEGRFPGAHSGPARIFYSLDNEPDLWSSTHARIHPEAVRYQELIDRNIAYGEAIKDVAPTAEVFGFVSYGWAGYVNLQSAPDAGGRDFLDTYLAAMAARETETGRRVVDVLDLHWYPEAYGGGVRITADDGAAPVAAARVQAPRSLWDPTYTEDSWIARDSTAGPIALLPRLQAKIAAHYPGTKLAFTEYYYGGGGDISGGIAQADVLGAFGREGVFAAALWPLGPPAPFIDGGFDMYRNLDGEGAGFGDVSIAATTDDVAATAVYASHDADAYGRMVIVAINRTGAPLRAGLAIRHGVRFTRAAVYRLTSASSTPVRGDDVTITATNAFGHELPANSVTTLVLTE